MGTVYFDHAATTPVFPEVVDEMLPYYQNLYGNPSSTHTPGRTVRAQTEKARIVIADALDAHERQLVFTSGGTEADNMALVGVALANRDKGNHIITTQVEHHAVLHTCQHLEELGFEVTYLPVDETGVIQIGDLQKSIRDTTVLISIMYGNNEVGVLQPLKKVLELAREQGVYVHTDAVQAFGIVPISVKELPVDLLSISAHKIGGPKGIGALYIGSEVKISPFMQGGTQEKKRRAGTENVPGIMGFMKATQITQQTMSERQKKYILLRKTMVEIWDKNAIEYYINGHQQDMLPHILNVSFPQVDTEIMLMNLDLEGVFCSSGSACTAGSLEISHVLKAMHLQEHRLQSAIRFSFGWNNTVIEAELVARKTVAIINRLKDR